jgi:hypothetical protein
MPEKKSTKSIKSEDEDSDDGVEVFAKGPAAATLPARRGGTLKRRNTTKSVKSIHHPIDASDEQEQEANCYLHVDVVKKLLLDHLMLVYQDLPNLLPKPKGLAKIFTRDPFVALDKLMEKQTAELKGRVVRKEKDVKKEKGLRRDIWKRFTSFLTSHSHNRQFGQDMGDKLHQLEHRIVCIFFSHSIGHVSCRKEYGSGR